MVNRSIFIIFLLSLTNNLLAENTNHHVSNLISQLQGGDCVYHSWHVSDCKRGIELIKLKTKPGERLILPEKPESPCEVIPYPSWWNVLGWLSYGTDDRWDMRRCKYWAATCLGLMYSSAESALDPLNEAAKTAKNMNTGDGSINTRIAIDNAISCIQLSLDSERPNGDNDVSNQRNQSTR